MPRRRHPDDSEPIRRLSLLFRQAKGIKMQAPPSGETVTYNLTPPLTTMGTDKSGWRPKESVTLSSTSYANKPAGKGRVVGVAKMLSPSGCATANLYYGMDALYARFQQTWCWNNGFLSYWPAAQCWGDSSWPTYEYLGCSTSQTYGDGWNQGRTRWNADLCPLWVPLWGDVRWARPCQPAVLLLLHRWLLADMSEPTTTRRDAVGLVMLVVGTALLPVVGWVIGVTRLWDSYRWTTLDKVLGSAMWPMAMLGPFLLFLATRSDAPSRTTASSIVLTLVAATFVSIAARLTYRLIRMR